MPFLNYRIICNIELKIFPKFIILSINFRLYIRILYKDGEENDAEIDRDHMSRAIEPIVRLHQTLIELFSSADKKLFNSVSCLKILSKLYHIRDFLGQKRLTMRDVFLTNKIISACLIQN